jgi:hypothetical protein
MVHTWPSLKQIKFALYIGRTSISITISFGYHQKVTYKVAN